MNSPFGSSNQGGYRGPSATMQQSTPQQNYGGFGGGFGGQPSFGYAQPQQSFGSFGGFGGQPSFGYAQPQQSFGGYQGGFNPMFGGIGGLGFNPMMGPQFMQPMQTFGGGFGVGYGGFGRGYGGFNPYQNLQIQQMQMEMEQRRQQIQQMQIQQMQMEMEQRRQQMDMGQNSQQPLQALEAAQRMYAQPGQDYRSVTPDMVRQSTMDMGPMQQMNPQQTVRSFNEFPSDMMYRGGPQMPPEMRQQREQDMQALLQNAQMRAVMGI